jgi:hypothetical protein
MFAKQYKNLLLPNVVAFNILKNIDDDDVNLGKALSMAYTIDGAWIQHAQDPSWGTRPSKHNIRFVGGTTMLHVEGHNSIRSEFEVHEHLMESLFDKLSNGPSLTSISHWKGLQIIMKSYHCFCRELCHRHGPDIHPCDLGPSRSMLQ